MKNARRLRTVVSTIGLVLASSGCAVLDEDIEPGPLDAGITLTPTCLEASGSAGFTDGTTVLRYDGNEPLTFESIKLINADPPGAPRSQNDFHLVEVELVPVRRPLVGSWSRWPPPRASAALAGAVPAAGAKMGAGGVTEYNVVAHLTRSNAGASAATYYFRYFYSVGGHHWGSVSPLSIEIGECTPSDRGQD